MTEYRKIAGQLFWRDDTYLLVDPDPLFDKRPWMTDNMKEFIVCTESGHVYNLVVTPPFAVSYRRMGDNVEIRENVQEVDIPENALKLFESALAAN